MLPSAHAVLWSMASFLLLWGVSLIWRGVSLGVGKRRCPACRRDVPPSAAECAVCGFASDRERDFRGVRFHWGAIATALLAVMGSGAAAYVGAWVRSWTYGESWSRDDSIVGPWASAAVGMAAFGAALAFWSWRGDRSRGRKRCPKCWYDMSGGGLTCPECGLDAGALKHLYRPRRRRKAALVGALLVLSSYGVWTTPRVQRGGWVAAIPTTVMILGWRWWPGSVVIDGAAGVPEDWSLSGRVGDSDAPRPWRWQRTWIRTSARSAIIGTKDVQVACRALHFARTDEFDTARRSQLLDLLVAGIGDSRAHVREAAAAGAVQVAGMTQDFAAYRAILEPRLDVLLTALDDPSDLVACCTMPLIWGLGPAAEPAVEKIVAVAGSPTASPGRRSYALATWRMLFDDCASARYAAAEWLQSPDPVRQQAAVDLYMNFAWGIGKPAQYRLEPREAESLFTLLRDAPDQVSIRAAYALTQRGIPDDAMVTLLLDQASGARLNRDVYLQVAAQCGPVAGNHLTRITGFLTDPGAPVRIACMEALHAMSQQGVDIRETVPRLRALVADPDPAVGEAARVLLEALGP